MIELSCKLEKSAAKTNVLRLEDLSEGDTFIFAYADWNDELIEANPAIDRAGDYREVFIVTDEDTYVSLRGIQWNIKDELPELPVYRVTIMAAVTEIFFDPA